MGQSIFLTPNRTVTITANYTAGRVPDTVTIELQHPVSEVDLDRIVPTITGINMRQEND